MGTTGRRVSLGAIAFGLLLLAMGLPLVGAPDLPEPLAQWL